MINFNRSLVLLLALFIMAGGVMAASAQADTLGPEPLLPCTQLSADKLAEDATPTDKSPLAELESFLARMHDNPFDAHVAQMARCYPLYFDLEVWPTWA